MLIDLHCHSIHSDGRDPPERVAWRAAESGVELFCLTDHDTCNGYEATVGTCPRVIRGVELSCSEDGRTVHLLLYDVADDPDRWHVLEHRLVQVREARKQRIRAIAARLADLGIVIDVDAIISEAGARTVGRPDIAHALVNAGIVSSPNEAFDRFLCDGGVADVPLSRLSLAQGLKLGALAGAKASLAHPHTLGHRVEALVARHRHLGLEGLECYYGKYDVRQRQRWLALARRHAMVATGGSDYHGEQRARGSSLGVVFPDEHAHRLLDWLQV